MIAQSATSSCSFPCRLFLLSVAMMGMALRGLSAEAASPQGPWECSNYTDEAQTRCLNAFIERQQEQIAQLEGRVQAQQDLVGQLKGQVDRQTAATGQLQQQLSQPPVATAIMPPPYIYPYTYAYPPVGIGLYLGRPWGVPGYYGYYARPYWGPRFFYRHYGRHW
ncbi:MAG TPA: hypothetical protein VFO87_03875 [Nitrospira sp.]|nr:hypothetical protein [Nitrospira sp.]